MKSFKIVCPFYECGVVVAIVKASKVTAVYYMPCELEPIKRKAKAEKGQLAYGYIMDKQFHTGE